MEAARMAAAASAAPTLGVENSVRRRISVQGASSSSSEFCTFSVANGSKKVCCSPLGLSGDGLGGGSSSRRGRRRRSAGFSLSSSSPSCCHRLSRMATGASAAAPVRSLQGESMLKDIDCRDLEAETPSLLEQSSDLDWKKLVDDLRSEALHGLQSAGLRALSLKALEKLMESWIPEQMVDGIESPAALRTAPAAETDSWNFEDAATELRIQANLQAAQALAEGVDSTFDWETDVAELHQRILLQGGAEPCVLKPEQRLWLAWTHAQGQMAESANLLTSEALESSAVNGHKESHVSKAPVEVARSLEPDSNKGNAHGKSLFAFGAAMVMGLAVEGSCLLDAVAGEASPEAIEAAARAPSWLVPAVLVFPPLSYFLFNVYRDKVNPYAKLTDWMFGVVAVTIFSNIVMMAVWGVRLY